MSIDALQTKIKKMKNTVMLDLSMLPDQLPPSFLEENGDPAAACLAYCKQLLSVLKGEVPAVRFRLLTYSLMGENGLSALKELTQYATSLGLYILLDLPGVTSGEEVSFAAKKLWEEKGGFSCDGVVVSGYFGSDIIRPLLPYIGEKKKDVFVICRSATRSSAEIQDLLTGTRTVHLAAADYANRFSEGTMGKFGFSQVGITTSATSADSIRMLRGKYPQLFMMIDGLEYPGGNAKNCALGFNRMGHGAIVSVGSSITCAWRENPADSISCAVASLQKIQKKLDRYITVL